MVNHELCFALGVKEEGKLSMAWDKEKALGRTLGIVLLDLGEGAQLCTVGANSMHRGLETLRSWQESSRAGQSHLLSTISLPSFVSLVPAHACLLLSAVLSLIKHSS